MVYILTFRPDGSLNSLLASVLFTWDAKTANVSFVLLPLPSLTTTGSIGNGKGIGEVAVRYATE